MLWSLLALSLATAQPVVSPMVAEQRAAELSAALRRDDYGALRALSPSAEVDSPDWSSAFDVIERFDRIEIESTVVRRTLAAPGFILLAVEVTARGTSMGRVKVVEALPARWMLALAPDDRGEWRLVSALTLERWLALALRGASAAELELAANAHPQASRSLLAREVADVASSQSPPDRAAVQWAVDTAHAANDAATECLALRMLARVEVLAGHPQVAVELGRRAAALAARAQAPEGRIAAAFAIGLGEWFQGHLLDASAAMHVTDDDFAALRDARAALRELYMAGLLADQAGELRQGIVLLDELDRQLARTPWLPAEIDAALQRGILLQKLGQTDAALAEHQRAERLAHAIGNHRAEALAVVDQVSVSPPQARGPLLRRAADLARAQLGAGERASALDLLASEELARGELETAAAMAEEALATARAVDDRNAIAAALEIRAEVRLRQGDVARAKQDAEDSWSAVATSGEGRTRAAPALEPWSSRLVLARALLAEHDDAAAERELRLAADALDRHQVVNVDPLARARLREEQRGVFDELLRLLLHEGRDEEALAVAEAGRGRALEDVLAEGHFDLSQDMSADEKAQEAKLEQDLATANRELFAGHAAAASEPSARSTRDSARAALDRFRATLYLRHPGLALRRASPEPLRDLGAIVRPGTAVLSMVVLERETIGFLVRRQRDAVVVRALRVPVAQRDLARMVRDLDTAIETRDPGFTTGGRRLYDLLIAPLASELAGVRTLAVIPDGVLWRLPFAALIDARDRPLVRSLAVFRAPSLHLLARDLETARARPALGKATLLAVGAPVTSPRTRTTVAALERDADLGPLPDAVREARRVADLYRGRSQVRVGDRAREGDVKQEASRFDVLHFATHGLVDDAAPMYSALVLAPDGDEPGDDGLLEAREIAGLRLHARLAVLSACATGGGRVADGEGIVGLSWAFLAAGVPTLVVSDRRVPSAATAALMVELHRRLLAGAAPAEALRQAQARMAEEPRYSHPYYWAGFTVVGAGW